LKENIGAAVLERAATELSTIIQSADSIEAQGARYPKYVEHLTDRIA
jgi:hypothetical protein